MAGTETAGRGKSGRKTPGADRPGRKRRAPRRRQSVSVRAGGTGPFRSPEHHDVPQPTPDTDLDRRRFDGGGI